MMALNARPGRILLLAALLVLLGSTDGLAQRWQWPEKGENLKVLPEDIGPDELSTIMRGFTRALGVRCEHCHDDTNGNRLSEIDFPADTKETKEIARIMLKMVRRINDDELSELDEDRPERVQVTCVTCHRGVALPRMLGDVLAEVNAEEGTEAAIAKYRELREQYYGGFSYDFGERSLLRLAERLLKQDKPDDAVAFQLALGPTGEVYREAGDEAKSKHDEIVAALKSELSKHVTDDGVVMESSSWKIRARNP